MEEVNGRSEWRDDRERHIGPWFRSPKPGYNFFLANLANFHVAAILAISTYIKPNMISERCTHNNGGLLIKCVSQIFPAKWKTTTNKINAKRASSRIRQIWDTLLQILHAAINLRSLSDYFNCLSSRFLVFVKSSSHYPHLLVPFYLKCSH